MHGLPGSTESDVDVRHASVEAMVTIAVGRCVGTGVGVGCAAHVPNAVSINDHDDEVGDDEDDLMWMT